MSDILGDRDPNIPDVPTRVAQPSRRSQLPKRFYKDVSVGSAGDAYQIELDGRHIKTPGKNSLLVPNEGLAQELAEEWQAQLERIDPMTMPFTRLLNTAIDGVTSDPQAVKEDIIRYAGTDMLCYRAGNPEGLVGRQREIWDPLIDWAQATLGCRFVLAEGIVHVEQPPESIAAFSTHVGLIGDPLTLSATHVIMALTGSATIAMAVLKRHLNCDEAWTAAHLDEDWNIELWGTDEEAEMRRSVRFVDMQTACRVLDLLV